MIAFRVGADPMRAPTFPKLEVRRNDPAAVKAIVRGLIAYNTARAGPENWQGLVLSIRDGKRRLVAGLCGHTHGGWLVVRGLWVRASHRKRGLGTALLRRAEKEAVGRGCRFAFLDTFSFQAPRFYPRMGYRVMGVLRDYPRGHRRIFFWKRLR